MAKKMKTMIDKGIIEIISLAKNYPTIKKIGIFGSYIRGDIHSDSDIDLLYDYDDTKKQSTDELLGYIEEINDDLINYAKVPKIDYIWYRGLIESENIAFRDAVLNDVIWAYEK
jgi:predicted nucleotidyltransferase